MSHVPVFARALLVQEFLNLRIINQPAQFADSAATAWQRLDFRPRRASSRPPAPGLVCSRTHGEASNSFSPPAGRCSWCVTALIFLNPPDFAKEVIKQIEADFATYEGGALPLPTEWAVPPEMVAHIASPAKPLATLSPVNLPTGYILGTSGKPPTS